MLKNGPPPSMKAVVHFYDIEDRNNVHICKEAPISHVVVLCYTGLPLIIRNKDLVVKEGDDLNIVCEPSSETVGLEWVLPEAVSNNADTVVEYSEPFRHVLTICNANIKHSGVYTCGVLGDVNGTIPSDSATVRVRESKIEKKLLRLFDIFLVSYRVF